MVLLEAMACGTPVVGSSVGGIPDIIQDGWNGYLVRERSPSELAERIIALLENQTVREQFKENGLRTVGERFSWRQISTKFTQTYVRLVNM